MSKTLLTVIALTMTSLPVVANEPPKAFEERTRINQYAGADLIKHPIGLTVTADGRLLAVESHTHFRPGKYDGPESDQIVWLEDTDHDGVADKRSIFFGENLSATMDIATHPTTGAIYVATRTGILRLWDRNSDGIADPDEGDRQLIFFDLKGNFLDNGCSGLCFDDDGNLIFGIGSILGEAYTLQGSDGIQYSDQGEGGNIWRCTKDGELLTRYATGLWNPFGVCHAPGGYIFATDNDPGSRPPCRLHQIVEDGDYGFQYRYGRSGQHPFISWRGELPGTLPMIHDIGEAPCDIIYHRGNLLVASWSNHEVEVYPLKWAGTHFTTQQQILLKGGLDFRPVAFAVGQDHSLYISDWVKQSYQVHGQGAIWRVQNWEPEECSGVSNANLSGKNDPGDPWTFYRMITGRIPEGKMPPERKHILDLLSARFHNKTDSNRLLHDALASDQKSEMLHLLALKWVADRQLEDFRPEVEEEIHNPHSTELFHAALTTKARLDGLPVMDEDIQKLVANELHSPSPLARRSAFLLLDDRGKVDVAQLREIFQTGDDEMRCGVALTLRNHSTPDLAIKFAREIVTGDASAKIRAFASLADPLGPPVVPENPLDRGEYLFHKNCAVCHRVEGFGKKGGPDLSSIGIRGKEYILDSIRNPSAEIAPQFEGWSVTMADGTQHVGFVVGEKEGIHYYSDISGNDFTIDTANMVSRESLPISLMPGGLDKAIGEEDFECLVDWLTQLK